MLTIVICYKMKNIRVLSTASEDRGERKKKKVFLQNRSWRGMMSGGINNNEF